MTETTTARLSELEPCPFCGGPGDYFANGSVSHPEIIVHRVACNCECQPFTGWRATKEEAIAAWNRRALRSAGEAVAPDIRTMTLGQLAAAEAAQKARFEAIPPPAVHLDAIELDMVKHGDFLGAELGAKVHAALVASPSPAMTEAMRKIETMCLSEDGAEIEEIFGVANAALKGAALSTSAGGVGVKPLEWEDCDELGLCADTIIGRYWMEPDESASTSWQLRLITVLHEEEHNLILLQGQVEASAVQTAAQADFEQRIRSALSPSGDGWNAAVEAALLAAENCPLSVPLTPGAADGASAASGQIIDAIRNLKRQQGSDQ